MMAPVIIVPGNNTVRPIGSHVWMALGLAAGLGLGLVAVLTHSPLLLAATRWLRPLGTLFLNLLSMVVIPLVATALFTGIAGLGDLRRVGRLGVRTLGFLWGTTLAAIVVGFVVAALLLPLAPITPDQQAALRQTAAADSGVVGHAAEQITTGARFILELIPSNPVRAAVDGNLLPLIVFITIFAAAAAALPDEKRHALTDLADVATQALIRIVRGERLVPGGGGAVRRPTVRHPARARGHVPGGSRRVSCVAHGRKRPLGEHREPGAGVHRRGPPAHRPSAAARIRSRPRHVPHHDQRFRNAHRGDRRGRSGFGE